MEREKNILIVTNLKKLPEILSSVKENQIRLILINETTDEMEFLKLLNNFTDKYFSIESITLTAEFNRTADIIASIVNKEKDNYDNYIVSFDETLDEAIKPLLNSNNEFLTAKNKRVSEIINKLSAEKDIVTENNTVEDTPEDVEESYTLADLKGFKYKEKEIIYMLDLISSGIDRKTIALEYGVSISCLYSWPKLFAVKEINGEKRLISITDNKKTNKENVSNQTDNANKILSDEELMDMTEFDAEMSVRYLIDPGLFQMLQNTLNNKGLFVPDEKIWRLEQVFDDAAEKDVINNNEEFVKYLAEKEITGLPDGVIQALYSDLNAYVSQYKEYVPDGISVQGQISEYEDEEEYVL